MSSLPPAAPQTCLSRGLPGGDGGGPCVAAAQSREHGSQVTARRPGRSNLPLPSPGLLHCWSLSLENGATPGPAHEGRGGPACGPHCCPRGLALSGEAGCCDSARSRTEAPRREVLSLGAWALSRDVCGCPVLLAQSGWRPGTLLSALQGPGRPSREGSSPGVHGAAEVEKPHSGASFLSRPQSQTPLFKGPS